MQPRFVVVVVVVVDIRRRQTLGSCGDSSSDDPGCGGRRGFLRFVCGTVNFLETQLRPQSIQIVTEY